MLSKRYALDACADRGFRLKKNIRGNWTVLMKAALMYEKNHPCRIEAFNLDIMTCNVNAAAVRKGKLFQYAVRLFFVFRYLDRLFEGLFISAW